jgi:hypothetical protein
MRARDVSVAVVAVFPGLRNFRTGHVLLARLTGVAPTAKVACPRSDERAAVLSEPNRLRALTNSTGALETLSSAIVWPTIATQRGAALWACFTRGDDRGSESTEKTADAIEDAHADMLSRRPHQPLASCSVRHVPVRCVERVIGPRESLEAALAQGDACSSWPVPGRETGTVVPVRRYLSASQEAMGLDLLARIVTIGPDGRV